MTEHSITLKTKSPGQGPHTITIRSNHVRIGHARSNEIILHGDRVHVVHAVIKISESGATVENAAWPKGGVKINDFQMVGVETALKVGDVLSVGEHTIEVVELVIPQKVEPMDRRGYVMVRFSADAAAELSKPADGDTVERFGHAREKLGEILGRKLADDETLAEGIAAVRERYQGARSQLAAVAKALRLVPGASSEAMVDAISRLHEDIDEANAALAEWCPECDPTRCSLSGTVALLIADVLKPQADRIADLEATLADGHGSLLRRSMLDVLGCNPKLTDAQLVSIVREIRNPYIKLRDDLTAASGLQTGIYYPDESIVAQVRLLASKLKAARADGEELRARLEAQAVELRTIFDAITIAENAMRRPGESSSQLVVRLMESRRWENKRIGRFRKALEAGLDRAISDDEFTPEAIEVIARDRRAAWDRIDRLERELGELRTGTAQLLQALSDASGSESPFDGNVTTKAIESGLWAVRAMVMHSDQLEKGLAKSWTDQPTTTEVGARAGCDSRLVEFFYLLTRDELSFGSVKKLLRELAPLGSDLRYTSTGGEAMAREIVHELLTGEKPPREAEADKATAEPKVEPQAEPGVVDWTSPSIIGRRVVIVAGENMGSHGVVERACVPGDSWVWVPVKLSGQISSYRYRPSNELLLAPEEPSE